jgi:hypothetical protein
VDGHISTDSKFTTFINTILPEYVRNAGLNNIIEEAYPTNNAYTTETVRLRDFVRDSTFTCNVRYLTESYGDSRVWNMQYSVSHRWHGTDLILTFFDPILSPDSLLEDIFFTLVPFFAGIANAYQSYLTSYIITGDPNMHRASLIS